MRGGQSPIRADIRRGCLSETTHENLFLEEAMVEWWGNRETGKGAGPVRHPDCRMDED